MAKRRRLGPVDPDKVTQTRPDGPGAGALMARPPIADVAGDAARASAFEEVAEELAAARSEGRLIQSLTLGDIDASYMIRDRLVLDPEEMEALRQSIAANGQRTPIEVVDRGAASHRRRYGLISGLRRLRALQELSSSDPERFGTILAVVRAPEGASEAYQAMIEENEIRAALSFYERAHLAVAAAEAGIYPDARAAVGVLFAAVPKAKRSKVNSFVTLVEALGGHLKFPGDIPEHLGLKLVKAIREEPAFGPQLSNILSSRPPANAAEERSRLEAALRAETGRRDAGQGGAPKAAPALDRQVTPGVQLVSPRGAGDLRLSGPGVTPALIAALEAWLKARLEDGPETGPEAELDANLAKTDSETP